MGADKQLLCGNQLVYIASDDRCGILEVGAIPVGRIGLTRHPLVDEGHAKLHLQCIIVHGVDGTHAQGHASTPGA